MPNKRQKTKPEEGEPAVRAAFITRKGTLIATVITVLGALLVAAVGKLSTDKPVPTAIVRKEKLVGRILDKATERGLRHAKVSVETHAAPTVVYTDSEGTFSFQLTDLNEEIHIKAEADGYEDYDLRITPSSEGIQEIRLNPKQSAFVSSNSAQPAPGRSPKQRRPRGIAPVREDGTTSIVRGRIIDAHTEEAIAGVRVSVVGYAKDVVVTGPQGEFELNSHKMIDQTFRLRAEKDGYSTKEQWHQAGSQFATIRLVRR